MSSLSRFDRASLATILFLSAFVGFLIYRGDQLGLRVVSFSPTDGAEEVSTGAEIEVIFNELLALSGQEEPFILDPPLEGTIFRSGKTLAFLPQPSLEPNTTYQVTLTEGIQSQTGDVLRRPLSWSFRTTQPRLLFLAQDEAGRHQLAIAAIPDGEPLTLTDEPNGLADYAYAPGEQAMVYAATREDGGNDLWAIDLDGRNRRQLLACPDADCGGAAWSPDGGRIIYSRRTRSGPPRLYWLDPDSGETAPVFEDQQILGFGATWSPDGQWINYVSPMEQAVRVLNVETGQGFLLPSQMGRAGVWSPEGDALLLTDIQIQDGRFGVKIFRVDLETRQSRLLSGEEVVEDASPAWSPDGQWVAFGRTRPEISARQQLWLMRSDGSQARPLTGTLSAGQGFDNDEAYYDTPAWSPDGRYLAMQRYDQVGGDVQAGVWIIEVETGQMLQLAPAGRAPTWLP